VRQTEKAVWSVLHCVHLRVSKGMIITANILVVCVMSKRERERKYCNGNKASAAARLCVFVIYSFLGNSPASEF